MIITINLGGIKLSLEIKLGFYYLSIMTILVIDVILARYFYVKLKGKSEDYNASIFLRDWFLIKFIFISLQVILLIESLILWKPHIYINSLTSDQKQDIIAIFLITGLAYIKIWNSLFFRKIKRLIEKYQIHVSDIWFSGRHSITNIIEAINIFTIIMSTYLYFSNGL